MKSRILCIFSLAISGIGTLIAITQFIMAMRFLEIGRVIFYLVLTIVLAEIAIFSALKLRNRK